MSKRECGLGGPLFGCDCPRCRKYFSDHHPTMTKKAAVVIDDWKEDIFVDILDDAGFAYTIGPGVTDDSRTITVYYTLERFQELVRIVKRCNAKAAEQKG